MKPHRRLLGFPNGKNPACELPATPGYCDEVSQYTALAHAHTAERVGSDGYSSVQQYGGLSSGTQHLRQQHAGN